MLSASPIQLTKYNPVDDTARLIYEIPVGIEKASWAPPSVGIVANSQVLINRSGLQEPKQCLERPETVSYLAALFTATTVGLSLLSPGVAKLDYAAAGANQGAATLIATPYSIVTSGTGGVRLPAITPLVAYTVINSLAVAINVYPATGDFIGAGAVNVAVSIPAGGRATFYAKSTAVANTATGIWNQL